jgi:predicted nucleic acid-binding Zn ribbon protein
MPIYEYQALNPANVCHYCLCGFEVFQRINENPLSNCIHCGKKVKKMVSWCHSAVIEESGEHISSKNKIKEYEKSGMWSHAAELADKHAEKIRDKGLKTRAIENYKKAGYDADLLAKHSKLKNNDK